MRLRCVTGKMGIYYSAIDSAGDTISFLLSPDRYLIATKGFLLVCIERRAPAHTGQPEHFHRFLALAKNPLRFCCCGCPFCGRFSVSAARALS
jgi:hypothetical protein